MRKKQQTENFKGLKYYIMKGYGSQYGNQFQIPWKVDKHEKANSYGHHIFIGIHIISAMMLLPLLKQVLFCGISMGHIRASAPYKWISEILINLIFFKNTERDDVLAQTYVTFSSPSSKTLLGIRTKRFLKRKLLLSILFIWPSLIPW